MANIAFFMGSFDPIHVGHINMIREALNSGIVDKVIVVPSGHNPWKKDIEPAPFALRSQMIATAIKPFGERAEVSDIEGTFEPPYYSNKPLNYFREKLKENKLFILCGEDTTYKIPKWKNAETDILPYYNIMEIPRFEMNIKNLPNITTETLSVSRIYEINKAVTFPVSSTDVRETITKGENAYPLIPISVFEIIKENKLYGYGG